jgi:hypothetical protein
MAKLTCLMELLYVTFHCMSLLQTAAAVSAAASKGVNSLDIPGRVLSPCSPVTPMGSVDAPGKTVTLADA